MAEEVVISSSSGQFAKVGNFNLVNVISLSIYIVGILFVLARFLTGLYKIYVLAKKGKKIGFNDINIIETQAGHLPFSFYRYIFLDKANRTVPGLEIIVEHERVHIQQNHTIDIVLIEILYIFYWFNPFVILYKQAIRQIHECLADEVVCQQKTVPDYIHVLEQEQQHYFQVRLGNQFFQSQFKKRIQMMTKVKNQKSAKWTYLATLPLIAILLIFLTPLQLTGKFQTSQPPFISITDTLPRKNVPLQPDKPSRTTNKDEMAPPAPPTPPNPPKAPNAPAPPKATKQVSEVTKSIDMMPRFYDKSCENNESMEQKENCSRSKLMEYIAANIKYPQSAKNDSIEGMVVAQFIVSQNGKIKDISILKEPGSGCGDAVKSLLLDMNHRPNLWIPGVHEGKKVAVAYTIPVRFKLN
ncbi:MAG: M56 family metallopeptidase [Saprospiraceae bacterium]